MGVLAKKDLDRQSPKSKGIENKISSPKKITFIYRVAIKNVPEGKTTASFFFEGDTKTVELENGLYVFKDKDERRALLPAMLKAGFIQDDVIDNGDVKQAITPNVKTDVEIYRIRFAHPDNTDSNPKTGFCAIKTDDTEMEFELDEFGCVWVENEASQESFKEQGWVEVDKEKVEK